MNGRIKYGRLAALAMAGIVVAAVLLTKSDYFSLDTGSISRPAEAQEPTESSPPANIPTPLAKQGDLSASEIALLQDLSARRQQLDDQEAGLKLRAMLLAETEKRIDEKIARLAEMEGQILAVVEVQEQRENEKLDSLVRLYERMRPRDAARMIEDLDMTLQLEIATRMRSIKMAAILSAMDPVAARDLTRRLASRAQLPPTDG